VLSAAHTRRAKSRQVSGTLKTTRDHEETKAAVAVAIAARELPGPRAHLVLQQDGPRPGRTRYRRRGWLAKSPSSRCEVASLSNGNFPHHRGLGLGFVAGFVPVTGDPGCHHPHGIRRQSNHVGLVSRGEAS
jgi:hypothetical protein